jgi:hypothetical protein
MLSDRPHTDKLLADLCKWQSARMDAAGAARQMISMRIDDLLDALWAALPERRRDKLRRGL